MVRRMLIVSMKMMFLQLCLLDIEDSIIEGTKTPYKRSVFSKDVFEEIPEFEHFLLVVEDVVEQGHQNYVHVLRFRWTIPVKHPLQTHKYRPDSLCTHVVCDLASSQFALEQDTNWRKRTYYQKISN